MDRQTADRMLIEARAAAGPRHASDWLTMRPAVTNALAWALGRIDHLELKWAGALEASREDVRAIIREEVLMQLQHYQRLFKTVTDVHAHMKVQDRNGALRWWPTPGSEDEFSDKYDKLAAVHFEILKHGGP